MRITTAALAWALLSAGAIGFAPGCKKTSSDTAATETAAPAPAGPPAARLVLMSNLAGALEPCGCSKDQLGGLDHLAAYLQKEGPENRQLLLAAGPLFYLDPTLEEKHATQDRWKADTIAVVLQDMGLRAWAPGFNDWAAGGDQLAKQKKASGAAMLADGLERGDGGRKLFDVDGLKIGVVGVAEPKNRVGGTPDGVKLPEGAVTERVTREVEALRKEGARLLVVLATLPRGQALRIADAVPAVDVLVIGKPVSEGVVNTEQPAPEMIGQTLVVETANHAQAVSVVDVYVDDQASGDLALADASGVKRAAQIGDLARRIRELEAKVNSWEKGGKVDAADLKARKADLAKLRAEKEKLEVEPDAPSGSFFRYQVQEVREGLGEDAAVSGRMRAFYKKVNEHNKKALADLKPPEPAEGEAKYIGVEECSLCHSDAREVWDSTGHAHAYATLEKDFKEYNLECVGCHVTGYGKPGGSTVTHNADLQSVQCETCHGPGSLHANKPEDKSLIVRNPDPKSCVEGCHHPPHVEGFDPAAKMDLILGPGHGK